jgi:AmmeMemoRadiSam system protein A
MEPAEREQAGEVLARAWRPGMVFLASSDFTHYGRNFGHLPFPTDEHVAARLEEQDFDYIEAAGSLDPDLFWETLARRHATVCGSDPIALLASVMAKLGDRDIYQTTLDYQTSGELSGDYRHSVSYAALGYYRRGSFEVDERDQAALLESASRTLEHLRATGDRRPAPAQGGSEALGCRRGMFVSLHRGDELLGCVGNGSGRGTVREDTAELTLAAALEDTRFRPAAGVRGPIDIEISLLTPFRRVRDASLLRAGQHGAFLRQGRRAGLLLPHVATEFGWETSQFLEALARKSGLGPKSWEDPRTKLFLFEAQRFSQAGTNTQAR